VSEFSRSFHIRTSSASKTERCLRESKMSGLLFGPANGWLTFVPYPHSDGLPDIRDAVGAKFHPVHRGNSEDLTWVALVHSLEAGS
jgi:hypothetical protein